MNWIKHSGLALCIICILTAEYLSGQIIVGAATRALGGISSIQAPGCTGIFNSPAAGRWDSARIVFADSRNLFGVRGLSSEALGISMGLKSLRIGALWSRTGSDFVSRQEFRIHGSGRISELLSLGLGLQYRFINMSGQYGQGGTPIVQLGMAVKAGRKTDVVIDWYNVVPLNTNTDISNIGIAHLRAGVRHRVSPQAGLLAEVHARYGDYPNRSFLRGGIWYQTRRIIFLAGAGNGPEPISFGMCFKSRQLRLDFSSSYHTSLGFSPQFSVNWFW